MTALADNHVAPNQSDVSAAVEALPQIRRYLADHQHVAQIQLKAEGERQPLIVPRAAVELLARILAHMAAGQGVSVVPAHAELTTQQAADVLNVSRPFLIGLLDAGDIEYRKVGTHRRIKASSLMDYMGTDDKRRRAAADELAALTQQMGLA